MLLILSSENDRSTDNVIDWLRHFGVKFIRINNTDEISNISIHFDKDPFFIATICDNIINSKDISSFWYRRGELTFRCSKYLEHKDVLNNKYIKEHLYGETFVLNEYINFTLSKKPRINKFNDNYINKLVALDIAQNVGLKIADTLAFARLAKLS